LSVVSITLGKNEGINKQLGGGKESKLSRGITKQSEIRDFGGGSRGDWEAGGKEPKPSAGTRSFKPLKENAIAFLGARYIDDEIRDKEKGRKKILAIHRQVERKGPRDGAERERADT